MIATVSLQPQYPGMKNRHNMVSLTANAAGNPLPLLPRRSQPQSWSLSLSPHPNPTSSSISPLRSGNEPSFLPSASIVTITPATPPKAELDSDSSPQRRDKKRKTDVRVPTFPYPPEVSTPIPAPRTPSSPGLTSTKSKNSTSASEDTLDATPRTPALGSWVYTPGMPLRPSVESLRKASNRDMSLGLCLRPSSSFSESLSTSSSLSSVSPTSVASSSANIPLIRKKSGQVVRPSLKSSSSYSTSRPTSNLGIASPNLSFPSSKSEPVTPLSVTTPTPTKAVHFDKNLAQVKLFLTEQKPLAVSREGSPVDTDEGETSGTENTEISRFFGSISLLAQPTKKPPTPPKLLMHTNVPLRSLSPPSSLVDLTLENLQLSKCDKSILGSVLVRNIAYDKTVTARFTFDGWCTRSDVNARWKQGVGPTREGRTEWDRFEFVIWLGDLRLGEAKGSSRKLELAVRYRVVSRGYEQWDNNGGGNYIATFERPGLMEEKERGRKERSKRKDLPVPFSDDELSDLLVKAGTSKTTRKSRSTSPRAPKPKWMPTSSDRSASPFLTTSSNSAGLHARTRSFPFSASLSPQLTQSASGWIENSPPLSPSPLVPAWLPKNLGMFENQEEITSPIIPFPKMAPATSPTTLGSPRDLADDTIQFKFPGKHFKESADDSKQEARIRRHQRGGYFDFTFQKSNVQEAMIPSKHPCTPAEPATPTPPSSRFHSFPPLSFSIRNSAESREDRETQVWLEEWHEDLPTDATPINCLSDQSSSSLNVVSQSKVITPSNFPPVVEPNLAPQDASDSSPTSTLLENESPPSSGSSTPPLEESDDGPLVNLSSDDRESYAEFLNRFCFFTGPGFPLSLSSTRKDEVMDMMKETISESSTPTITPSGSIQTLDRLKSTSEP